MQPRPRICLIPKTAVRSPPVRLQITRNIGLLRLAGQLLPVLVPMSSVPRGTQCDFGGTGAAKRKGCTLPRKMAARTISGLVWNVHSLGSAQTVHQ